MRTVRIGDLEKDMLNQVGGKARGLDFLKKNGYKIAEGFVITDVDEFTEKDLQCVLEKFDELGANRVSVRSSASNEDGEDFSNAGQYETVLDVKRQDLKQAIDKCISSLHNKRATEYSKNFLGKTTAKMNVVIEEMIDAVFAGVVFTTNPVNKDEVLIEAVDGKGEDLVSGSKNAFRYTIAKKEFCFDESGILSEKVLKTLYDDSIKIAKEYGSEVDLEWVVDKEGQIFWLQLRPITTLDESDIDEFNTVLPLENHLLTTRNIGEMLPGAVTPLTISTSVLAIDYGIRNMFKEIGVVKRVSDLPYYFMACAVKHHLFIDMTALYRMSTGVFFASPKNMNVSIMGEWYENYPKPEWKNQCFIKKFFNIFKFVKYLFSSKKAKKRIAQISEEVCFSLNGDAKKLYDEITTNIPKMNESLSKHYVCSSFSGSMNSALFMMLEKSFKEKADYQAFVATMLSDIDGIESADILCSLQKLANAIVQNYPNAKNLDESELLKIVTDQKQAEINALYKEFVVKHGHRSIKEAEMRSKAWKNDPIALMKNLRTVLSSEIKEENKEKFDMDKLLVGFRGLKKGALKFIGKNAREAVKNREFSKSHIIRVIDKFKDAYIRLAKLLVENGSLLDEDSIYFLTHEEIGKLIDGDTTMKKKALSRRNTFSEAEEISFNDVCVGTPQPVVFEGVANGESLKGVPVCKGKVYGRARVVKSFDDATKLEKGEIMVAPFTDIGWSPYYSIVSALITEVGSALSHGAVVAREYCLPTIVNTKSVTKAVKTGDYLYVDASKGTVTFITEEEYKSKVSYV